MKGATPQHQRRACIIVVQLKSAFCGLSNYWPMSTRWRCLPAQSMYLKNMADVLAVWVPTVGAAKIMPGILSGGSVSLHTLSVSAVHKLSTNVGLQCSICKTYCFPALQTQKLLKAQHQRWPAESAFQYWGPKWMYTARYLCSQYNCLQHRNSRNQTQEPNLLPFDCNIALYNAKQQSEWIFTGGWLCNSHYPYRRLSLHL